MPRTSAGLADVAFITGLLVILALIARLRGTAVLDNGSFVAGACLAAAILLGFWEWVAHRLQKTTRATQTQQPTDLRHPWRDSIGYLGAAAVILAIFATFAFYLPMRYAFWDGYDDPGVLTNHLWTDYWNIADQIYNRPFSLIGQTIALSFSPDSIDGFFWLAVTLRLGTGLALYGIVQQLLPRSRVVALIAALLFVINPSEPGRFFAIAFIGYQVSVFLMTLAAALYLYSFRHGIRWMLILACLLLGMALLSWETAYPLAVLMPLLLWLAARTNGRLLAWAYAWWGMTVVLAVRLIVYLLTTPDNYQLATAGMPVTSVSQLLGNLGTQLKPTLAFVEILPGEQAFIGYGAGVTAVAVICLGLWAVARRSKAAQSRRSVLVGIPVAVLACVLGILPYFKFPTVMRTQFFAAPAQAVLWALLIALIGTFLWPRVQRIWLVVATGGLILLSAMSTMFFQVNSSSRGSSVNFEKLVYVYQQVHQLSPNLSPDTLILFVSDDFSSIPFRVDYNIATLTYLVLGVNGISSAQDPLGWHPIFEPDGIYFEHSSEKKKYAYSEVVAFDLAPDGRVTLLQTLPKSLIPDGVDTSGYHPESRIQPGQIGPLRYMRDSSWMKPYDPDTAAASASLKTDIVDPSAAIKLGNNWYPFETFNGQTFRWVNNDAEIVTDPSKPTPRVLSIELEPGQRIDGAPLYLQILDATGQIVDKYGVTGLQTVSLQLPASTTPMVYRLHVESSVAPTASDPRTLNFRVFRILASGQRDIVDPSAQVTLGDD
jgi:hypothetical protein